MKYNFSKLTERLSRINFAKIEDITKYDEKADKPKYWYTQFIFGCILFSLINSGKISENYVEGILPKNKKFSLKTPKEILDCINYQWYTIRLWYKLSDNLTLDKETYNKIQKNIQEIKKLVLNKDDFSKLAIETLQLLKRKTRMFNLLENGNSLINGSWVCDRLDLDVIQSNTVKNLEETIKSLPKYSLLCMIGHWQVFLGCKDNKLITINPQIFDDVSYINFEDINEIDAFIVNNWRN